MISDDEEDEVSFQRLTLNRSYIYPPSSTGQNVHHHVGDYEEENDIHQQLAEKDHYLILAAEAGKVLLEKNQELTKHFESLQEEYFRKIEGLQQDRYHLRKALNEQGEKHESCMQDLQQEINNLGGQVQVIQRSSRAIEQSTESTYENLSGQNSSLLLELENVKAYNKELTQQVDVLTGRIDQQDAAEKVHHNSILYDEHNDSITSEENSSNVNQIDYSEVQGLKETVRQLVDQKDFLEESLSGFIKEKYNNSYDSSLQESEGKASRKMSFLEGDVSNLREQVMMCQEEINLTRRRNENLKDQLEEYVLMQSSQPHLNTSLLNELELSIPEVDMNFHGMSTPLRYGNEEDSTSSHVTNTDFNELKAELQSLYYKLSRLKNELTGEVQVQVELELITGDVVNKLVDEIIDLIQNRAVGLGEIVNLPTQCQVKLGSCDDLSQPSDQASDILEQHVQELNLRLNIKTSELENVKKELLSSQKTEIESNDKAQELTVNMNYQERELEKLRKEREILLNNETMDKNLKKALQDRDEALTRENETKSKYETAQSDMQKLNNQLIAAVQQKHELSEQLEQWQFDMAALIDKQVNIRMTRDNQNSRKRSKAATSTHKRSFAAKLFTTKSSK